MKESWLIYNYLRSWWTWLLLASAMGALAGLGYYSTQTHPVHSWWKAVVLGSVIGTLLAVGVTYLWEDARAYHRYHRTGNMNT